MKKSVYFLFISVLSGGCGVMEVYTPPERVERREPLPRPLPQPQYGYLEVMSSYQFEDFYEQFRHSSTQTYRLERIAQAKRRFLFTCTQIRDLMELYRLDSDKLRILNAIVPNVADWEHEDEILEGMNSRRGVEQAQRILLQTRRDRYQEEAFPLERERRVPSENSFQRFVEAWTAEPFESDRKRLLKEYMRHQALLCSQIVRLLRVYHFDSEKLEILRIISPNIADPRNSYVVIKEFTFEKEKAAKLFP